MGCFIFYIDYTRAEWVKKKNEYTVDCYDKSRVDHTYVAKEDCDKKKFFGYIDWSIGMDAWVAVVLSYEAMKFTNNEPDRVVVGKYVITFVNGCLIPQEDLLQDKSSGWNKFKTFSAYGCSIHLHLIWEYYSVLLSYSISKDFYIVYIYINIYIFYLFIIPTLCWGHLRRVYY